MTGKNNIKRIVLIIIAAVTVLAVAAAILFLCWRNGSFLPDWIKWQNKEVSVAELVEEHVGAYGTEAVEEQDLTSGAMFDIKLANKTLSVSWNDNTWRSPKGVKVQDFLACDIDHDGENELMLLCWKIGRYGAVSPRFGKKEEKKWIQHIYIYDLKADGVNAIWLASDIGMDVVSWNFDQRSRLEIIETSGRVTHWDWISWGLDILE